MRNRVGPLCALSLGTLIAICGCGGQTSNPSNGAAGLGVTGGATTTGSTTAAACDATPTQLVDFNALAQQVGTGGVGATQLAVDATSVYLVFGARLLRIPIQGGPAVPLLQIGSDVTQNNDPIATSTAVIFHHEAGTGTDEAIVSVPKAGGTPTSLATTHGRLYAFTANDEAVYFVDDNGVQSVPSNGGTAKVLTSTIASSATGIAVVGTNLLVTTGDPFGMSGTVASVPIAGGTPATLAKQQGNAQFPMACGSDVCWWTGAPPSPMGPTGPGFIARLAGGMVSTVSAPVYPWSLTFDGTDFFETVGCDVCSGTLVRIPASGGPAATMATAGFAAVEGDCVYFTVAAGFDLPSSYEGGIPGSGVYAVRKSYADPRLQGM